MRRTRLPIFEYTDFRRFLEDRLAELRNEDAKYSRRYICKRLELAGNNYLKLIIDGARNLTEPVARKLVSAIGLRKDEASFFLDLVRYNHAKSIEAKAEALETLKKNRRFRDIHQLQLDHLAYMVDPLTLALREMVNYPDFREDPAWIAKQLTFKASRVQIEAGLEKLIGLELIKRDDRGRLQATYLHTATGDKLGSVPLRMFHRTMLEFAQRAIELPVETRYFRGLTMSIPAELYPKIVDEYCRFVEKVRAMVDGGDDCDHVYHLETGLFPLARGTVMEKTAKKARKRKSDDGS